MVVLRAPGNLFYGPQKRANDPGSRFDAEAAKLMANDPARYTALRHANECMMAYIADPSEGSLIDFGNPKGKACMEKFLEVAYEHFIVPWNADNWVRQAPPIERQDYVAVEVVTDDADTADKTVLID